MGTIRSARLYALVFLWENREQYHLNLECACLLGESAGGYLAAAMLTFPYRKSPFRFQRGILVNPITDLLDSKWGKYLSSDINKNNDDENRRCLSPLWQISADVCPISLMHGTEDHTVSLSHSQEFYRRMQMAQRYTELHLFEHTGHAFLLAEYSRKIAAVSEAIGVIDSLFRQIVITCVVALRNIVVSFKLCKNMGSRLHYCSPCFI